MDLSIPLESPAARGLLATFDDGEPMQPFWQLAQRSEEWFAARHHRITGSVVPRLLGMFCRSYARRHRQWEGFQNERHAVRQQCYRVMAGLDGGDTEERTAFEQARIQFGVDYEDFALNILAQHLGYPPMCSVGLLIDPVRPWRGCSVDALFADGFAEAKCSIHKRPYTDSKPYHRVQMEWNQSVLTSAFGPEMTDAWFVGFTFQGSVVKRMRLDPIHQAELEREMWQCIREYVHDFCPEQGVQVPGWLKKVVF